MKRQRLRAFGHRFGTYPTGPLNAITDVDGVKIGHVTLIEGARTRTGATAILPHGGNIYQHKVPAGFAVLNGYGKFAGSTQIEELGEIETPIVLTNTLAVGRAIEAINHHVLNMSGNENVTSLNAVVGETNDGRLNDIRAGRPSIEEIAKAIGLASAGPVEEGTVGAGTGTVAFGMKGGIGTSSRHVRIKGVRNTPNTAEDSIYTIGILVQANYGGRLRLDPSQIAIDTVEHDRDGSIVIIVATDAPLTSRNLTRLAKRSFGGLACTGAALSNGSGDYALAFSTAESVRITKDHHKGLILNQELSNDVISPLFEAAIEATEEAIYNALSMAVDMDGFNAATGKKSVIKAMPLPHFKTS